MFNLKEPATEEPVEEQDFNLTKLLFALNETDKKFNIEPFSYKNPKNINDDALILIDDITVINLVAQRNYNRFVEYTEVGKSNKDELIFAINILIENHTRFVAEKKNSMVSVVKAALSKFNEVC